MNTAARELKTLLERQHHNLLHLADILQDERTALTSGAVTNVEAVTEAKQACLQSLEDDMKVHLDWLAQTGLATDEHGIMAYLRRCDPDGQHGLDPLWRKIKALFSRCREQNLLNGKVVLIHQRQTQQALAILRGGALQDEACYGPKGHTPHGVASRILGRV